MAGNDLIREHRHLSFLVIDQFSMLCLAAAMDPLRAANRLTGTDYYRWSLVSVDGNPVHASNGMVLKVDQSLDDPLQCDVLFVCSGYRTEVPRQSHMLGKLRERARRGGAVGALSIGSHILGQAGLLKWL